MFDTNRRSGISTSELGLYSDRSERRCHRSGYGTVVVKQFVVVVMIIITIVLIALYVYDVTSSTSILHRPSLDTKHLHIYRNSFEKPNVTFDTFDTSSFISAPVVTSDDETRSLSKVKIQDRSDTVDSENAVEKDGSLEAEDLEAQNLRQESGAQMLYNFQLRQKLLKQLERQRQEEEAEPKFFNNHAMVYRLKPSPKNIFVSGDDDDMMIEESEPEPSPFHFEFKTPYPSSFKRLKYPQLTQYRYPHSSRSIQDIIKYMANDPANPHRGIKFTGVYLNPKKYDTGDVEDFDEALLGKETNNPISMGNTKDPLFRYKPRHPADVNLLAPTNFRFSPLQRFSPYGVDPYYYRPSIPYIKSPAELDTTGAYSISNNNNNNNINNNNGIPINNSKKRKAKPFSVMLDIYPITEINDYSASRPRPTDFEDYDFGRPMQHTPRFPKNHPIPLALPNRQSFRDEEEKQQMILHLNLYPRRKGKNNRNDIFHQSESRLTEDRKNGMNKVASPIHMIAKQLNDHFATDVSKSEEIETTQKSAEKDAQPENLNAIRKLRLYQKARQSHDTVTEKVSDTTMATVCEECFVSTTENFSNLRKIESKNDSLAVE